MDEAALPWWAKVGLRRIRRATAVRRTVRSDADIRGGPDFMCIGGQRCGTQWLYDQLEPHPDFWMPPYKELHYFDGRFPETWRTAMGKYPIRAAASRRARGLGERDRAFFDAAEMVARGRIDADRYAKLFAPKGALVTGDITPCYSILSGREIDRIAARFPALKVVFTVRDPIDRFWSQVCLELRRGTIRSLDPQNHRQVLALAKSTRFTSRSMLSEIARRWRERLPAPQFRVFFFDDLAKRPDFVRGEILQFLGADPTKQGGRGTTFNPKAAHQKVALPDGTRRRLGEFFAAELASCAEEFGGPARAWADRYRE